MSSLLRLWDFLLRLWRDESGFGGGGSGIFRLGLGLVGLALGSAVGQPQLGLLFGSLLGSFLFPEELPDIEGNRLDPDQVMTSSYGDSIPIGLGQFVVGGTMSFYPGFDEHVIENEVGGKGGSTQTSRSFTYTGNFRVNWCEGPIDAVLKIWANRLLIYDRSSSKEPILDLQRLERAPGSNAIRIYLGEEDQLPDPTEEEIEGFNNVDAYRGIAGGFFQNYPLDDTGGVPPQMTALITTAASEVLPFTRLAGVGTQVAFEWQPGKATFMCGREQRFSSETEQVLAINGPFGITWPQFPCVDSDGNFYEATIGAFEANIIKYDGITLQQILVSKDLRDPADNSKISGGPVIFFFGRVFGGVRTPEGRIVGELLYLQRQNTVDVADSGVFALDQLTSDTGGTVEWATGVNRRKSTIPSLVVDSERFLWTLHNDAGDAILTRFSPGSGQVAETYTVTGVLIDHMAYDQTTNSLILGDATDFLMRWSLDTHSETARLSGITYTDPSGLKNRSEFWNGPTTDGRLYLQTSPVLDHFRAFNIHTMVQESRLWSPFFDWGQGSGSNIEFGMFDEKRNARIMITGVFPDLWWFYVDRVGPDVITVKQIVDLVGAKVGLTAADMNTSNLTQTLVGYLMGSRREANKWLEPLRQLFFFNPVSEDFIIKFPLLGGTSIATIPEDDLAAGEGDPRVQVDRLTEELIQEIELPEVLELEYANEKADFQKQIQRVKRPRSTTNSRRQRKMIFPGTFITNSNAKQRLNTFLYQIWTKRRPVVFRTAQKWLRLSPTDVVTVEADGFTQQVVLAETDVGANNVIEFKGGGRRRFNSS